ncbi:uncharacterized protein N0V89_008726 [Didymosphaeria variabile]|uniref:Enoyl-CoA hydratase n=1 Tax=Didymosphaeria variabile TaxID=1932322 RepID=A0A9W9C828_9PLEO|nr:uncharacterized protein N0V89_008726 [Didymosphaeria variabile]KAJ4350105.1 hypothetical protein N0V89_008726 [Didymosphaeria variabile]
MHPANKDTEVVVVSKQEAGVTVVELNRPIKRNALSQNLIDELLHVLRKLDRDVEVRAIVLTSTGQSPFCAGADIQELAKISTAEAYRVGWLKDLETGFSTLRTPVIAAVRGYAAMEFILTGEPLTAQEMERYGIVNRVVPIGQDVVDEAMRIATRIATCSAPAIGLAKQAIKAAEKTTLEAGLEIERALYYSSFSLEDCKEGIAAFLQKRPPGFVHE